MAEWIWGNVITGSKSTRKGKIGFYKSVSETDTKVAVTLEIWFASMYSLVDENNSYTYSYPNGSSTTSVNIKHSVDSGSGWDDSNRTKLGSKSYSYDKTSSSSTKTYTAKITGIDNFGSSNVSSVTTTVTVPARSSYKITYNANGGSGAPSAQSTTTDKTLKISSTTPTRAGYTFQGWATSSGGSVAYQPGDTYSGKTSITLYAVWRIITYTISYNANGGSGAPGNQTKNYGSDIAISSTKPTRTNYNFRGWSTSSSGTTVTHQSGDIYTANANLTLYAVWEITYNRPKVYDLKVSRCTSEGDISDDGLHALLTFEWDSYLTATTLTIEWENLDEVVTTQSYSISGTHATEAIVIGGGSFDLEHSYTITVIISDGTGSSEPSSVTLPGGVFIIDILSEGKGLAFGKPAEINETVDFGWEAKFNKPVCGKVLGMDRLPEIPAGSDLNEYLDPGCFAVRTIEKSRSMLNIPIQTAGRLEVWSSTGQTVHARDYTYLRQRFVPYSLKYGTWERDFTRYTDNTWQRTNWMCTGGAKVVLYDNSNGTDGTVSLSNPIEEFEYLEIFFTDNNGLMGGYTKVFGRYDSSSNSYKYGSTIDLSITEAASSTATYIRRTKYDIAGYSMTPKSGNAGYVSIVDGTVSRKDASINRIKVKRVVGHYA